MLPVNEPSKMPEPESSSFNLIVKVMSTFLYKPFLYKPLSTSNLGFSESNFISLISGALLSGFTIYFFTSKPLSVGYFIVRFDSLVRLLIVNLLELELDE